jgi:hypothetical protein
MGPATWMSLEIVNLQQLRYSPPTDPPPSFRPWSRRSSGSSTELPSMEPSQLMILHRVAIHGATVAVSSSIPTSLLHPGPSSHLAGLPSQHRAGNRLPWSRRPSSSTGSPLLSSTPNRGPLYGAHPRPRLLRYQLAILSSICRHHRRHRMVLATHHRRFFPPLTTCHASSCLTRMWTRERIRSNAWWSG